MTRTNPFLGLFFDNETGQPTAQPDTPLGPTTTPIELLQTQQTGETVFTAVTSNIRNTPDLPANKVRAAAKGSCQMGDIVGFQEIGADDKRDVMVDTHTFLYLETLTPIAINNAVFRTTNGPAGKVLGTPANKSFPVQDRHINYVTIEKVGGTLKPFTVFNTHMIVGRTSSHEKSVAWAKHYALMRDLVNETLKTHSVIILGDFNARVFPAFASGQRSPVNIGIDKIFYIESNKGIKLDVVDTWSKDLTKVNDHLARAAKFRGTNR